MTSHSIQAVNNPFNSISWTAPLQSVTQWVHVPISMFAVPLLSLFGVQWLHGMEERVFEERQYFREGQLAAELHYEKQQDGHELPVLELYTEDEYEMGFSQGYLLGKEIDRLFHLVLKPMLLLASVATGDFSGSFYQRQIEEITIPLRFAREISGLVAGVHRYAEESCIETSITEDIVQNSHKLTDIYKSILCQRVFGIPFFNSMGCSTAVVKKGNAIGICRTLDWPSMGMMGEYTLLRRHTVKGMKVEMQTFPGIIGALTASNEKGLVAIINEVGIVSKAGVPYNLLTREIIDHAASVKEAKMMIDAPKYQAASSHHLTLADRRQAINFQMHVLPDQKYVARELHFENENEYLIVTNHALDDANQMIEDSFADSSSKKRFASMTNSLGTELEKEQDIREVMKKALQSVNVLDTVAAAMYTFPEEGKVVPEQYVHDNFFAAEHL